MMADRKAEAETFRCALLAGCATVAEVVAWADEVIAAEATPDSAIIEVSLAAHRSPIDVVSLLKAIPGHADGVQVRRRMMSRMLRLLDKEPSRGHQVARWISVVHDARDRVAGRAVAAAEQHQMAVA